MKKRYSAHLLYLALLVGLLTACQTNVPPYAKSQDKQASTQPDNSDAVLPPNIAPLNFCIEERGEAYCTHLYTSKGKFAITISGKEVQIPLRRWRHLLTETKGDTLYTDIYVKIEGEWNKYATRRNPVAQEEIDSYISYRLIEPSYVDYETLTINQRNLTNFDEKVIYDNSLLSDGDNGQCINCHSYQDYNRNGQMQMHVRQRLGGTVITNGNELVKVNLKTPQTLSAGVYPAWHPTAALIAYSVNTTGQSFHTKDSQKIEVTDAASDLILYDADKNEVYSVSARKDEFETYPAWSPDGKRLYYASAHFEPRTSTPDAELDNRYTELKYNLYSRPFDEQTLRFGPQDTIFMASERSRSATLPRISPDGHYLLFTMGDYGNFHIWHRSSDLYIKDLQSGQIYPLVEANSTDTESYHSWSSNGRWIIFSSRRDDGSYTRLYLSYFDREGRAHRPFVIPQKNSHYYTRLFKSYNIPEFMVKPVAITRQAFVRAIRKEALPAHYAGQATEESGPPATDAHSGASPKATPKQPIYE